MAKENTEQRLEALLSPVLEELAYELVDLEFVKEGQSWYLRLYLDKEGGITLDDCEKASRAIEVVMDEKDPIEQAYYLEVSSPGLDRPLKKEKDFIKYAGEVVDIKLYRAQNKKKTFQGELVGLKDDVVTILDEAGEPLSFARKDIAQIRLAILF